MPCSSAFKKERAALVTSSKYEGFAKSFAPGQVRTHSSNCTSVPSIRCPPRSSLCALIAAFTTALFVLPLRVQALQRHTSSCAAQQRTEHQCTCKQCASCCLLHQRRYASKARTPTTVFLCCVVHSSSAVPEYGCELSSQGAAAKRYLEMMEPYTATYCVSYCVRAARFQWRFRRRARRRAPRRARP